MSKSQIIHSNESKMKHLLETANNVASSKASVLIFGESGTGKELLAKYIHKKSQRASQPFIAINCAAVPDQLLESELFGYEKGAFTGADQSKMGKFEAANGGTFLLDEISEMPVLLQAKILRVLQESEVQRLGGTFSKKINVRIIATSNKSLPDLIEQGKFREDLYYRLNVIPLYIHPLRERKKDIILLSEKFIETSVRENNTCHKILTQGALKKLLQFPWPGNVRQLQNVIERAVLLSHGKEVLAEDIQVNDRVRVLNTTGLQTQTPVNLAPGMTVAEAEKKLIIKTLEHTEQNRTQAAKLLGISIRTLRNKINEYKRENSL